MTNTSREDLQRHIRIQTAQFDAHAESEESRCRLCKRFPVKVHVRNGTEGTSPWIDACIAGLVEAVNKKFPTTSSCCGHGASAGCISFYDQQGNTRELIVPRIPDNPDGRTVLCPVCRGLGKVMPPDSDGLGDDEWDALANEAPACANCNTRGVVPFEDPLSKSHEEWFEGELPKSM